MYDNVQAVITVNYMYLSITNIMQVYIRWMLIRQNILANTDGINDKTSTVHLSEIDNVSGLKSGNPAAAQKRNRYINAKS